MSPLGAVPPFRASLAPAASPWWDAAVRTLIMLPFPANPPGKNPQCRGAPQNVSGQSQRIIHSEWQAYSKPEGFECVWRASIGRKHTQNLTEVKNSFLKIHSVSFWGSEGIWGGGEKRCNLFLWDISNYSEKTGSLLLSLTSKLLSFLHCKSEETESSVIPVWSFRIFSMQYFSYCGSGKNVR